MSETERQNVDLTRPYWMALVADVKNKTVCVLNPRSEDKYAIAANGYMLQWRLVLDWIYQILLL